tara:strand:- start:12409 stop:13755 length:1347 start_codon:yes stop_codon:yes gene_type:complete
VVRILYLLKYYPIQLVILHFILGAIASKSQTFATVWGWSVIIVGVYYIIKTRNRFNAAIMFSGYLVGLEIVLRMTNAVVLWELGKYGIIVFLVLGLLMEDIKHHRVSIFILIYLLLLLPSISLVPYENFNLWRQTIAFNLSGPLSLFISFLHFRNRIIDENELIQLFKFILLPLFSMTAILIIRIPELEDIVFGSEANFQMSGGYGPNQVSSALGLVITIIALSKILGFTIFTKNIYDYGFLGICSIQAYLTLARGGVLTAILAIFSAWLVSLGQESSRTRQTGKITYVILILIILWNVASDFTHGAMERRYISILDVDASGELSGSGRMLIMAADLGIFADNLLTGVGPGVATYLRGYYGYGKAVAAHSEFTRMLAEHGLFGLFSLGALIFLSLKEFTIRKKKEKCILVCFVTIAILTMLHSAMRLCMPGFIFGLSFFKIDNSKNLN